MMKALINLNSNTLLVGQNPGRIVMSENIDMPDFPFGLTKLAIKDVSNYIKLYTKGSNWALVIANLIYELDGQIPNIANLIDVPTANNKITYDMTKFHSKEITKLLKYRHIKSVYCFGQQTYDCFTQFYNDIKSVHPTIENIYRLYHPSYIARFGTIKFKENDMNLIKQTVGR